MAPSQTLAGRGALRPLHLLGVVGWLALVALLEPRGLAAQEIPASLLIGQRTTFHSALLAEERPLLVSVPASYAWTGDRYPVLYLLDGDTHFHHVTGIVRFLERNTRIPETIVVAIPNTERARDLTTASSDPEELPARTGGADRFLGFFADELIPWVDAHYRTQPFRILVGHSLGGFFAVRTLLERPEVFQAHIAVSPSLWWNDQSLVKSAESRLKRSGPVRFLYLTTGDQEPTILKSTQALVSLLERVRPPALTWRYRHFKGDDHGSTPHRSVYDGLEALFEGFRPDALARAGDMPGVEAHYAALSRKYGYTLPPPPGVVEWVASSLVEKKRPAEALALIERHLIAYPRSPGAHTARGEALEAAGRGPEALAEHETALRLATEEEDPDVYVFKDGLARARYKLEKTPR